jgi:hypothetical protein
VWVRDGRDAGTGLRTEAAKARKEIKVGHRLINSRIEDLFRERNRSVWRPGVVC